MTAVRNVKYLFIYFILAFVFWESDGNLVVSTKYGKLEGKERKTLIKDMIYHEFWGIPYAKPPVGKFRFLPPVPHENWDGILKANKENKPCIQINYNVRKGPLHHQYGNEDCLYLNVFAPGFMRSSDVKNPVIVFIYNELFRNSYNSSQYGPDFFIEEGVIIVQVHHRLSVLGFISTEDEILPGNAGLKDIVLSLQWIQDNVVEFGGNPNQVTLMGVQGGAVAVDLLLHTQQADNLFHRVILQSGTSFSSLYLQEESRQRAFKLAEKVNRASSSSKSLLSNLKDAIAEDLLIKEFAALPDEYSLTEQKGGLAFAPIVEKGGKGFLTEYPENNDNRINVPIMMGFNSREGIDSSIQYLNEPRYLTFAEKYFRLHIPIRTGFKFDPNDDAYLKAIKDIKKKYFTKGRTNVNRPSEYITYMGDVVTMYPIDFAIKKYANTSSSPIFYYHFDFSGILNENKQHLLKISTVNDGTWGAVTGDELCYLFVCPMYKKQYIKIGDSNSEEYLIQSNLVRMWANFARYGGNCEKMAMAAPDGFSWVCNYINSDPTPNEDSRNQLKWLPFDKDRNTYLHIKNTFKLKEKLYARRFQFWDEFLQKWRKYAVDGIVRLTRNTVHDDL